MGQSVVPGSEAKAGDRRQETGDRSMPAVIIRKSESEAAF
jgi:hypothetical protein